MNEKLDKVLAQAKAYFALPKEVRDFIRTDAGGYAVSRRRSLRAALLSGDSEQEQQILSEITAVNGPRTASELKLKVLEDISSESLKQQN